MRFVKFMLFILLFILCLPGLTSGQELISERYHTQKGEWSIITPAIPHKVFIKEQRVDVKIRQQAATVTIEQVFHSTFPNIVEGTYFFPIPDDAAVSKFSLWMGGQEVAGTVLDAQEARRIYQGIVSRMRDPALLEYMGSRMFKASVYPIPANGDAKIKLQYEQMLRADSGLVSFSYPLNLSRYTLEPLKNVSVNVDIQDTRGIKTVYSPTHGSLVVVGKDGENHATASFEKSNYTPELDFLLYYTLSNEDFGLNMATHRMMGEDGYFMMMIAPKTNVDTSKIAPKDIVFVLDTSGSMNEDGGVKIQQAKQAMKTCISHLREEDRYNIISFNMDIRKFKDSLIPVSKESRGWGHQFVDGLAVGGGTNINDALLAALKQNDIPSRLFIVCFVTDGMPTVGERDHATIVKNIESANTHKSRVFVFGVGSNLNALLLDRIADSNNGARTYVNAGDDMETRISDFSNKISYPVLSNLSIEVDNMDTYSVYPKRLPDLFKGSQFIVSGRYKGEGSLGGPRLTKN